uniref:Uncharacterized protein n=1 Tax=Romanomermis culicivorax TaxID=13658 RepID=A0A915KXI5_ROMCU
MVNFRSKDPTIRVDILNVVYANFPIGRTAAGEKLTLTIDVQAKYWTRVASILKMFLINEAPICNGARRYVVEDKNPSSPPKAINLRSRDIAAVEKLAADQLDIDAQRLIVKFSVHDRIAFRRRGTGEWTTARLFYARND